MDRPEDQETSKRKKIAYAMNSAAATITTAISVIVGGTSALAGVVVLGWQAKWWLNEGYWHAVPISAAVYRVLPESFWLQLCGPRVGMQKIVFGILGGVPLGLALLLFGFWFFLAVGDSAIKMRPPKP